jgi:hypothetical protein
MSLACHDNIRELQAEVYVMGREMNTVAATINRWSKEGLDPPNDSKLFSIISGLRGVIVVNAPFIVLTNIDELLLDCSTQRVEGGDLSNAMVLFLFKSMSADKYHNKICQLSSLPAVLHFEKAKVKPWSFYTARDPHWPQNIDLVGAKTWFEHKLEKVRSPR